MIFFRKLRKQRIYSQISLFHRFLMMPISMMMKNILIKLEELLQNSRHLVIPVHSHEQCFSFNLSLPSFQFLNSSRHEDLSSLSFINFPLKYIELILFNWPFVSDCQGCCGDVSFGMQDGQVAKILIYERCSCSSMLDLRMPTKILIRAENTINMVDLIVILDLIIQQIGAIEVKSLQLYIHSIVIESFEHYPQSFKDCRVMSSLQFPFFNVAVNHLFGRQGNVLDGIVMCISFMSHDSYSCSKGHPPYSLQHFFLICFKANIK